MAMDPSNVKMKQDTVYVCTDEKEGIGKFKPLGDIPLKPGGEPLGDTVKLLQKRVKDLEDRLGKLEPLILKLAEVVPEIAKYVAERKDDL